eukprot:1157957-Pelagomonas_calceolata.AAC.5
MHEGCKADFTYVGSARVWSGKGSEYQRLALSPAGYQGHVIESSQGSRSWRTPACFKVHEIRKA